MSENTTANTSKITVLGKTFNSDEAIENQKNRINPATKGKEQDKICTLSR